MDTIPSLSNMVPLTISYGRRAFPSDVKAVWGARFIWPNDLVQDRQSIASIDDEFAIEVVEWLNGPNQGDGALFEARRIAGDIDKRFEIGLRSPTEDNEVVLYEDDKGIIIASAQSSHGYLYVCAWIKSHTVTERV